MRSRHSRSPLALALFMALAGACGGGEDGVPAEYETVPGPNVPQAPAERRLSADGECTITTFSGEVSSAPLLSKVEGATGATTYSGQESGYHLEMACGDTVADVQVSLYFARGTETLAIGRWANAWHVGGSSRPAQVITVREDEDERVGDAGDVDASDARDASVDADADADAAVTADAGAPPSASGFVNGLGLPGTDGTRPVVVTLSANGVIYSIRATIPWRASVAPATCQEIKPGTGTTGSGGGCGGGGGSSRRSSGGDWD